MRIHVRSPAFALFAGLALLLAGSPAPAGESEQPLVVKIQADWCGTCQRLKPTFKALEQELGGKARLVVLDVTDREAIARSRAEAETLGITEFFDRSKGQTGTVGVLDASGEPVAVLKGETDTDKYVSAVAKARQQPTS